MPHNARTLSENQNGVILNAYPDSLAGTLRGALELLRRPELEGVFSQIYLLPTIFNSDLDRGFSIIDYDLNKTLVQPEDLRELKRLGLSLKLDLVLNHLSVNAPQFQDLLHKGSASNFTDFFIDWNEFWEGLGRIGPDGYIIPDKQYLQPLFLRKPGLPLLKVRFPDGKRRFFWNTFYQDIRLEELKSGEIEAACNLSTPEGAKLAKQISESFQRNDKLSLSSLNLKPGQEKALSNLLFSKSTYRGQLDLNARSKKVWLFYEQVLAMLKDYGATVVRLDAFAYLHKEPGLANFFNRPGTWRYLEELKKMAARHKLAVLPEIHAEYGSGLYKELAGRGYLIYDFFLPGLVIEALEKRNAASLLSWAEEINRNGYQTINMLGCHDGIPLLDLKGGIDCRGVRQPGLLSDDRVNALVNLITARGGKVKDLYGPDGKKISYYQVNATFFSALGEDERKLLLARAIQLFMPGRPQVWYLDLFAGKNNYAAVERGDPSGHKEINRTNLNRTEITAGLRKKIVLDQLRLIRLRNCSPAFSGSFKVVKSSDPHQIYLQWKHIAGWSAALKANLGDYSFSVEHNAPGSETKQLLFK